MSKAIKDLAGLGKYIFLGISYVATKPKLSSKHRPQGIPATDSGKCLAGSWLSAGPASAGLMAALDDLRGFFQP